MGGIYWCLNLVLSQASCFAAAKLYTDNASDGGDGSDAAGGNGTLGKVEGEGRGFPPSAAMAVIQAAFALWLVSLVGFFASIDKSYLHTFFDLVSSKQHVVRKFRTAPNDYEKMMVFTYHKSYYASFQKDIKV